MVTLYILIGVVVALIIFGLVYYFAAGVGVLKKAKLEWAIAGLESGFVPQGLCYIREINKFLISGYMPNSRPSRVYIIDGTTKQTEKFFTFKHKSGEEYIGHAGGIATNGEYAFISSEGKIFRFLVSNLTQPSIDDTIVFDYEQNTENQADFCYFDNGLLYVGEFYKAPKFNTDVNHHILLEGGKQNNAIIFAFRLSEKGVPSVVPEKAISIPGMVQGMTFYREKIYLSASYAMQKSKILVYENALSKKPNSFIVFNRSKVPLYILSDKLLKRTIVLPPMSENIIIVDNRMYLLFESNARKYRYFMRTRIKNVYSISLN